ncbi:hypothetical protein [Niabella drilacis]|uniref:Adhesin domain-containing protein n=1 Tax=Niabella drilacis (strain DSM 25811 / CCM 8410 / CCUG 62505 / LMG 26954 / E90) TaxID=1285928 RepID=A0A1G6XMV5_NIADE|nr:hypothetical protein [Niabella drilacis]SDD78677.1 hypothetical protein SAMN04487894_113109 [Niabella drilacis]
MKRALLCLLLTGITPVLFAQRVIEKTYKTAPNQPVLLQFGFPKIKIRSWNRDEIYIKATVNINDNKQNDRFELRDQTVDGKLHITDTIDFKHIDQQYYIEVDGIKKHFESKADFENYKTAHKNEKISSYSTNNVVIDLEVVLPVKEYIQVRSKFGLVEVQDYAGPLTVQTEFGKIDARLKESNVGTIKLTNQFGKIYSDFNLKPTKKEEKSFYTSITAAPGRGPAYDLSSKFGNIYLRNTK